jgi:hypothetical protein
MGKTLSIASSLIEIQAAGFVLDDILPGSYQRDFPPNGAMIEWDAAAGRMVDFTFTVLKVGSRP